MNYQRSISISGDLSKALGLAQVIFAQNNFRVKQISSNELELIGPGMSSTHQNPLVGISKAWIKGSGQKIKLEAELGSVRNMQWFIWVFPFALGIFLFIFIGALQKNFQSSGTALLAVSPWIVLSPLMSRWMKRRTEKALDTLLENLSENPN